MFGFKNKYIKVKEYVGLSFIPFHQLSKINEIEPYVKTIKINEDLYIDFLV